MERCLGICYPDVGSRFRKIQYYIFFVVGFCLIIDTPRFLEIEVNNIEFYKIDLCNKKINCIWRKCLIWFVWNRIFRKKFWSLITPQHILDTPSWEEIQPIPKFTTSTTDSSWPSSFRSFQCFSATFNCIVITRKIGKSWILIIIIFHLFSF